MDGQVLAGQEITVRYAADAVLPPHLKGSPWQQVLATVASFIHSFTSEAQDFGRQANLEDMREAHACGTH